MPPGLAVQPRIRIDLNVRLGERQTYAGFEDVFDADPVNLPPGTPVEVFEEESGLRGPAVVAERDFGRQLVYLNVDWAALAEPDAGESVLGFLIGLAVVGAVKAALWVLRPLAELVAWGGRELGRELLRWQCQARGHPVAVPSQAPGAFEADGECPRCGVYVSLS